MINGNLAKCGQNFSGSNLDWKTAKTWKMGEHFPVREKSWNFYQAGKVIESLGISGSYDTGKIEKKILENSGKFVSQKK